MSGISGISGIARIFGISGIRVFLRRVLRSTGLRFAGYLLDYDDYDDDDGKGFTAKMYIFTIFYTTQQLFSL